MIHFTLKHPRANYEMLGLIPEFFLLLDPRPAREQINANYSHGGGWSPMKGWIKTKDGRIIYPGDQPLNLIAEAMLRDEKIQLFEHAWVCITQPDGTFEVARMD